MIPGDILTQTQGSGEQDGRRFGILAGRFGGWAFPNRPPRVGWAWGTTPLAPSSSFQMHPPTHSHKSEAWLKFYRVLIWTMHSSLTLSESPSIQRHTWPSTREVTFELRKFLKKKGLFERSFGWVTWGVWTSLEESNSLESNSPQGVNSIWSQVPPPAHTFTREKMPLINIPLPSLSRPSRRPFVNSFEVDEARPMEWGVWVQMLQTSLEWVGTAARGQNNSMQIQFESRRQEIEGQRGK